MIPPALLRPGSDDNRKKNKEEKGSFHSRANSKMAKSKMVISKVVKSKI